MAEHNDNGALGEELAARYLIGNGFVIRDRQWTHRRLEIDIIAENDALIIFVEVKTRSSKKYGSPLEAIDSSKESRILEAAEAYIETKDIDKTIRFDCIAIVLSDPPEITHLENAIIPELE